MDKHRLRIATVVLLALTLASATVHAQEELNTMPGDMPPPPSPPADMAPPPNGAPAQPVQTATSAPSYTQAQIDQMLAPIALYPDPLIAQILMASTYPLEVVEESRWLQDPANAGLKGDQLAAAVQQQPWDPSVKSLAPFPQVLTMMNSNLQWTEQLGDAFLAQQPAVMDSVQRLRHQAQAAGHFATTPQQTVTMQGPDIVVEPAQPQVVYVPVYNPMLVYGPWLYPGYPPYYFPPYPGYAFGAALFGFGVGILVVDSLWGWDHWDWGGHRIDIDAGRFSELNRGHGPVGGGGVWTHDPDHRRGVPYRDAATRARFQGATSPETRRNFRGFGATAPTSHAGFAGRSASPAATGSTARFNSSARSTTSTAGATSQFNRASRTTGTTQRGSSTVSNASVAPRATSAAPRSSPMFESFSRGSDVRAQSARGATSRSTASSAGASRGGEERTGSSSGGQRDNDNGHR